MNNIQNILGTSKLSALTKAVGVKFGQDNKLQQNAFTALPVEGSGTFDVYSFHIDLDTGQLQKPIIQLQGPEGATVSIDLDPDEQLSVILSTQQRTENQPEILPEIQRIFKAALQKYVKNVQVFVPFLGDGVSSIFMTMAFPSNFTVVNDIILTGNTTLTMNKIAEGLDEMTVEEVTLTFTNNDDLKVTIDGTDYTDANFNYLTAQDNSYHLGQANRFLNRIAGSLAASSDKKVAFVYPVAIDGTAETITFRVGYASSSTVALAVVAVAD